MIIMKVVMVIACVCACMHVCMCAGVHVWCVSVCCILDPLKNFDAPTFSK